MGRGSYVLHVLLVDYVSPGFFDTLGTPSTSVSVSTAPVRCERRRSAPGRCSLCRFPTAKLRGEEEPLDAPVEEAIRRDFPGWKAYDGICGQCADLYEARASSAVSMPETS
jgi:hypothetical protein